MSNELNATLNRHVVALGAGERRIEERQAGGVKSTGKILFAANPTADDTITVGDVTLTFKASADAGLDEVTLGGTLSLTLDAIIAKLGTYTTGSVPMCAYTKTDTNTAVTATAKHYTGYLNSTTFPLASSAVNGTVTAMTTGVDGFLSLEHEVTFLTDTPVAAQGFSLAAGAEGQRKTIALGARTNAVNMVVYPTTGAPVVSVTFDAANEYIDLICLGGKWRNLGSNATVAAS
jgi:hypothetical protein